jgi:serine protease AprX
MLVQATQLTRLTRFQAMDDPLPSRAEKIAPYIIMPPDGQPKLDREALQRQIERLPGGANISLKDDIPLLGGVTATLDGRGREALEKLGYRLISDETLRFILPQPNDKKRETTHYDDRPQQGEPLRRPQARPPLTQPRFDSALSQQFTGRGVGIAVVDTGIYPHPDFITPNNRIAAFKDFVNGRSVPYDDNGHGTHVAGDAVGNGSMSAGLYRGPAREANVIGVKVLNKNGGGRTSDILKGINWVVENRQRYNIRVMNLSLGNRATTDPEHDPIYQAVGQAVEAGIVVVVAAGNEGPNPSSISTPGDHPDVITVGAVDDFNTPDRGDDRIPDFSSRGPTLGGVTKPDLVAPGEAIIGPNAPVTPTEEQARKYELINETLQWLRGLDDMSLRHVPDDTLRLIGLTDETIYKIKTSPTLARMEIERLINATDRLPMIDTSYVGSPGTSMATPMVAGVAAQMLEANPSLTPSQVKQILKDTAHKLPRYGENTQGAGMIDPAAALARASHSSQQGTEQP